jgi:hypothetical protein
MSGEISADTQRQIPPKQARRKSNETGREHRSRICHREVVAFTVVRTRFANAPGRFNLLDFL